MPGGQCQLNSSWTSITRIKYINSLRLFYAIWMSLLLYLLCTLAWLRLVQVCIVFINHVRYSWLTFLCHYHLTHTTDLRYHISFYRLTLFGFLFTYEHDTTEWKAEIFLQLLTGVMSLESRHSSCAYFLFMLTVAWWVIETILHML